MSPFADRVISVFSLRTFILVIAAWLILALPVPETVTQWRAAINHALFRVALDFSALPSSQTHLTVVHVSALEYDSWLADIPGAERLETLLLRASEGEVERGAVMGLVLERPLSLIQSQAEAYLADIHQGRRTRDHLYDEVAELLVRRERLVERLHSPRVVLGVENRVYEDGTAVVSGAHVPWVEQIPAWMRTWLWPEAKQRVAFEAGKPVFRYAPIWQRESLARPLVIYAEGVVKAGFELSFLEAAASAAAGDAAIGDTAAAQAASAPLPAPIEWLPQQGFRVGDRVYRASVFGETTPLYGSHSQLRSPLRQLSLDAALAADLQGWVLIGRDGSETLEYLAQNIAALADGATVVEPLWWSPLRKALLVLAALMLCFVLPRCSRYWKLTNIGFAALTLVLISVLAQSLYQLWLPVAELLLFMTLGLVLMVLWQNKTRRFVALKQHAQQAQLALSDHFAASGQAEKALAALGGCDVDDPVLSRYYALGQTFADSRRLTPAFEAFSTIAKHRRRFRDVPQKIKALRKALQTERLLASETAEVDGPFAQTQALSDSRPAPPRLGRYEIRRELGRGANGTVFLGFDPQIDREVAIKTLHYQAYAGDALPVVRERFFKEARAVGRLAHPNIVAVYDVGEEGNLAYMTMDYARGRPLSACASPESLLPVAEVYRIVAAVADALAYAHHHQVIHRDIKPSNIIYQDTPFQVRVTDFGIARLIDHTQTHTGEILGSPLYMAPEQLRGAKIEPAVDIFSLGVTFYQLLTGQLPFQGDNIANLSYAITQVNHISVRKVRRDLPSSAARIINVALQKKPQHRYGSALEFASALKKALKRDFGIDY